MKPFLNLFLIATFLCVAATSCDISESPTTQKPVDDISSPGDAPEDIVPCFPEYSNVGVSPDKQLIQSMMRAGELDRVESQFGALEWSCARQFYSNGISFVALPITPIREQELSFLVASPGENDLLIFVISVRAKQHVMVLEEDDELRTTSDVALSFEPAITLVRAPGLDDCSFIALSDLASSPVAGIREKVARIVDCFAKFGRVIPDCIECGMAISECLAFPALPICLPMKAALCLKAAFLVYTLDYEGIGDLVSCLWKCLGQEDKIVPTQESVPIGR